MPKQQRQSNENISQLHHFTYFLGMYKISIFKIRPELDLHPQIQLQMSVGLIWEKITGLT